MFVCLPRPPNYSAQEGWKYSIAVFKPCRQNAPTASKAPEVAPMMNFDFQAPVDSREHRILRWNSGLQALSTDCPAPDSHDGIPLSDRAPLPAQTARRFQTTRSAFLIKPPGTQSGFQALESSPVNRLRTSPQSSKQLQTNCGPLQTAVGKLCITPSPRH